MTELEKLIASARQQAAEIAAKAVEDSAIEMTLAQRAAQVIKLESARQMHAWANFAEQGMRLK